MGLLDFLKKKEKEVKKEVIKEKKPLEKKEEFKPEVRKPKRKISERAYQVLSSPHITEKATMLEKENKYIFKVRPKTNKTEIRRAVEDIYGVDVVGIKIINIPKKRRRLKKQAGWRKGYKKAIIKIKKGQKIEVVSR